MENSTETTCRLCLNVITNENCLVIEAPILHLLNLNVKEDIKSVVCTACSKRLFEAYHFKITCMDTEDNISSHLNSDNITPIDLSDVYLKINGNEHLGTVMEDERICRLCMHIVTSGFTSVENVKIDMIQTCIPEINFSSTKYPVICVACLDSLVAHSSFLKSCLKVEEQIKSFNNYKDSLLPIKVEEVEIKSEKTDEDSNCHKRNLTGYTSEGTLHNCVSSDYKIEHNGNLDINQFEHQNSLEVTMFKCHVCDFKTKYRNNFLRHQVTHENVSNVQLYECSACNFKTKNKDSFRTHHLKHKSSSEVRMYNCDTCDYRTKYKHNIPIHQLTHKDSSEVRMYTCETCDFQTKLKSNLKSHLLKHKDPSEMQLYTCDECHYKTKWKSNLVQHQRNHRNNSKVRPYKRNTYDFRTKYTHHLTNQPNDGSSKMYDCGACGYRTKYRSNLSKHRLTHKDSSELRMHKCDTCDYETKRKSNLNAHMLKHKDRSEIQLYKCDICGFEARLKGNLKAHILRHKERSEMQYPCDTSNFDTKQAVLYEGQTGTTSTKAQTLLKYECDV